MAKVVSTHSKFKGVIVSKFDMRKVQKGLKMKLKEIQDFIVYRFNQIGVECVKIAREKGSYHDITGNLRSSIGYVILVDGKPVKQSAFEAVEGRKGDGTKGSATGQSLIASLQTKFPWGVVLIVCAGMNYAAYVENVKHKDVLTSAELVAEKLAKQLLQGIMTDD